MTKTRAPQTYITLSERDSIAARESYKGNSTATARPIVPLLHQLMVAEGVMADIDNGRRSRRCVNLDIGGGKYEVATDFLREHGVDNLVDDPSRNAANRRNVADRLSRRLADTVTCANVLNVIPTARVRQLVIEKAACSLAPWGTAGFQMYDKSRDGLGEETTDGWQENRVAESYEPEIARWFSGISVRRCGANGRVTVYLCNGPRKEPVGDVPADGLVKQLSNSRAAHRMTDHGDLMSTDIEAGRLLFAEALAAGDFSLLYQAVDETSLGKHTQGSVYFHASTLDHLPGIAQAAIEHAMALPNFHIRSVDVFKFSLSAPKMSLLSYPYFWSEPFPSIWSSCPIDLSTGKVKHLNFKQGDTTAIIHRKEEMILPSHPRHAGYERFTTALEDRGAFDVDTNKIGHYGQWHAWLKKKRIKYHGHKVVSR